MHLSNALITAALLTCSASARSHDRFTRRSLSTQGVYWNATFYLNPPCEPGPQGFGFAQDSTPPFNVDCNKWDYTNSSEYSSAIVQASSQCSVTLYSDTGCSNKIAGPFTNNPGSNQCQQAPNGQKFMGYKVECQSSNNTMSNDQVNGTSWGAKPLNLTLVNDTN